MDKENERIGLQEIIDKAIEEMAREAGDSFELDQLNLAEFSRRTGLSRSKARSLKAKGFVATPHGRCGMRAESTWGETSWPRSRRSSRTWRTSATTR